MSVWGDQWVCRCGWHNFFMRRRCRACGVFRPPDAFTETAVQVMSRVNGMESDDASDSAGQ